MFEFVAFVPTKQQNRITNTFKRLIKSECRLFKTSEKNNDILLLEQMATRLPFLVLKKFLLFIPNTSSVVKKQTIGDLTSPNGDLTCPKIDINCSFSNPYSPIGVILLNAPYKTYTSGPCSELKRPIG